jgi:chitinase
MTGEVRTCVIICAVSTLTGTTELMTVLTWSTRWDIGTIPNAYFGILEGYVTFVFTFTNQLSTRSFSGF